MESRLEREAHEAADIFSIDEESLGDLANDIRANGQQVPIELLDGKIIDGRRRYKACRLAGIEPKFRDVNPADPVDYVLSLNLHRRHLNGAQRSIVGAKAKDLRARLSEEAAKRKAESTAKAGKASGASSRGESNVGSHDAARSEPTGRVRDQIGKLVGVSGDSVAKAAKVIEEGIPEVVHEVEKGNMSLREATRIVRLSPDEQREELEQKKTPKTGPVVKKDDEDEPGPREIRGIGIIKANEAIDCLSRIPKDDALRKRGFQLVTDWLKHNH